MENVSPKSVSIVEELKKSYEHFKIPFPIDNVTDLIEQQHKEVAKEISSFIAESNQRICDYRSQLDHLQAMIPFDQMTMEDFIDAFPNHAADFHNRPTFWPHDIAEQPGPDHTPKVPITHMIKVVPTDRTISCGEQPSPEVMWRLG